MSRIRPIFSGENKNTDEYIALRNEINTRLALKQQISDTVFDRFMVFLPILISVTTAVPELVENLFNDVSDGTIFIFDILPPVLLLLLAIYVFYSFLRYDENWNQVLAIAMYSIIVSDRAPENPLMVWERGLFVQELEDSEIDDNDTLNIKKPKRIHALWNKEFALCLCAVAALLGVYFRAYLLNNGMNPAVTSCDIICWVAIIVFSVLIGFLLQWAETQNKKKKLCSIFFAVVLFLLVIFVVFCCFGCFETLKDSLTKPIYIIAIAATSAAAGYVWEKSNPKHHTETKLKLLIKWWEYAIDYKIRECKDLVALFRKPNCTKCNTSECKNCTANVLKNNCACAACNTCANCEENACTLAKICAQYKKTHQSQQNQ